MARSSVGKIMKEIQSLEAYDYPELLKEIAKTMITDDHRNRLNKFIDDVKEKHEFLGYAVLKEITNTPIQQRDYSR